MSELTLNDVDRLARLAKLGLATAARERLLGQLNAFFATVEQMRAVDTHGVEPLAHPTDVMGAVALHLHADVVDETIDRSANQRSAPQVEDGLFLVPRVIE